MIYKLWVGALLATSCLVCSKVYAGEGSHTTTTTIGPPTVYEEVITIDIPGTSYTERGCTPWAFNVFQPGYTKTEVKTITEPGEEITLTETDISISVEVPDDVIDTPLPPTGICSECDEVAVVVEEESEPLPMDAIVANLGLLVLGLLALAFMVRSRGLDHG